MAGALLARWLGDRAESLATIEVAGEPEPVMNPAPLMVVQAGLMAFGGFWKKFKQDYELVEGDIPLDEPDELRDFTPEPVPSSADVIQYRDAEGRFRERPMARDQIEALLNSSAVSRVYKLLVKGPWSGAIKEMFRQLSDDKVARFVDPRTSVAYAVCFYVKGQPSYRLMTKRM